MHELSICRQMLNQVNEIALQNQATVIKSISLKIGPLSGVEAESLKRVFPFAAAQTIAENAELIIEELPVVIQCNQCGSKINTTPNILVCNQCGDYHTQLISGDEMLLVSVELSREESTIETSSAESNYV